MPNRQGGGRCYIHPKQNERMNPEAFARFDAAKCLTYMVDPSELENAARDLILG